MQTLGKLGPNGMLLLSPEEVHVAIVADPSGSQSFLSVEVVRPLQSQGMFRADCFAGKLFL